MAVSEFRAGLFRPQVTPLSLGLAAIALGLLALYLPTIVDLAHTLWATDEQAHGPVILLVALYLIWTKRSGLHTAVHHPASVLGWSMFGIGLIFYILGRAQSVMLFEIGSLIWVLCGLVLALRGLALLRHWWFPLLFLIFMLPLPGPVVDAVTLPMKMAVSYVVESLLYALGYPIARTGVILHIGHYKLLIADACAGLQTLFTLEAMGLLYLSLVPHKSVARNFLLAILIVPISFLANVLRVIILTLVTYHFGDEAGQGFLHGFAGMVLFISALVLTVGADSLLRWLMRSGRKDHA